MVKDYFSFETIRDKNGEVVCYHVTAIGTIEKDGETRMRSDLGDSGNRRMAFGKLTVRNRDHMIGLLLRETGSRVYWRSTDDQGPYAIISFAAREKHAEEIYNLNEGDRVLIEGRAYIRQNSAGHEDRLPELSITVSSSFLLGRRRRPQTMTSSIIPQNIRSYAAEEAPKDNESYETEQNPQDAPASFGIPSFTPMSRSDDDAPFTSIEPMVSASDKEGELL